MTSLGIGHYRVDDLPVEDARHHVPHPLDNNHPSVLADRPRRRLAVRQRHHPIAAAVHDEARRGQGAQTGGAVGLRDHGVQLAEVGGRLEGIATDGVRHVLGGVGSERRGMGDEGQGAQEVGGAIIVAGTPRPLQQAQAEGELAFGEIASSGRAT